MESKIKSFFKEENIGSECLSDLKNFGEIFFFFILYLKRCFEDESGPLTSCSFINCCLFFSKIIQK